MLPCVGIFAFCGPTLRIPPKATLFCDCGILCELDAFFTLCAGHRVVIFVKAIGAKLSRISESIIRAICEKPDVLGVGLKRQKREKPSE